MPKSGVLFWLFLCHTSQFLAHLIKLLIDQYIIVCQFVTQAVTEV